MLRKFIVVGLGGSGTLTVRFLREELEQILVSRGLPSELPDAWQLLAFDVKTGQSTQERDPRALAIPPLDEPDQFHSLTVPGLQYRDVYDSLFSDARDIEGSEGPAANLRTWVPDKPGVASKHIPIDQGAGQYRAIGRTVSTVFLGEVFTKIRRAVSILDGADSSVTILNRAFGVAADQQQSDPIAIVICSMAGGTGAGMVMDVCDMLRSLAPGQTTWGDNSLAMLYSPEVYTDGYNDHEFGGVHGNALGLICEMMAGRWTDNRVDSGIEPLATNVHFTTPVNRGPGRAIIVGRSGLGGHVLPNRIDVFQSMARSLGGLMTSSAAQENLIQSTFVAQTEAPSKSDLGGEEFFHGLGFASLSLGRDKFVRYAQERIARHAVDTLLRGHERPSSDPRDDLDVNVRIEWPRFVRGAGLDENGREQNQVIDAIRSNVVEQISAYRSSIMARLSNIAAEEAGGWMARFDGLWQTDAPGVLREIDNKIRDGATEWITTVQTNLVGEVERVAAKVGLRVAYQLLIKLEKDLTDSMSGLDDEANAFAQRTAQVHRTKLAEAFQTDRPGQELQADASGGAVYDALTEHGRMIWATSEASLRRIAAELIAALRPGVVQPLQQAVRRAINDLVLEDEGKGSMAVDGWAKDGSTPSHFKPSANEVIIEPVSEYPSLFNEQLKLSVPREASDRAIDHCVADVICGRLNSTESLAGKVGLGTAIEMKHSWSPAIGALELTTTPRQAEFTLHVSAKHLYRRANQWIHGAANGIGPYVRQGMATYLEPQHTDANTRRTSFIENLADALRRSKPLIRIETSALMRVHGLAEPVLNVILTELPIGSTDPLFQAVRSTIANVLDIDPEHLDIEAYATGSDVGSIRILTLVDPALDFPAISSITEAIQKDWAAAAATPREAAAFWQWRKTYPLPGFVPTRTPQLAAMIRGWFLASVLQLLQTETAAGVTAVRIARLHDSAVSFPTPMLTRSPEGRDLVAGVFESMALALIRWGSEGDPTADEWMDAYRWLLKLGNTNGSDAPIRGWIFDGSPKTHVDWLRETKHAEPGDVELFTTSDPEARRDYVVKRLKYWQDRYSEWLRYPPGQNEGASAWELRREITEAFVSLIASLVDIRSFERERSTD